jgi:c-di-GMP-binding flagellar brake protein YcgR
MLPSLAERTERMGDGTREERRQAPRADRVSLVHLVRRGVDGSQQELATGRTLNLSLGGIRLGLDHGLPLGARVDLTLLLDGELIDASGSVVYEEPREDLLHAVGIEFLDLSAEARARIERYLGHPPPAVDAGGADDP